MLWLNYFSNTVSIDIVSVLKNEAPISREMLIRRVLASWSVTRIGSRIDAFFNKLFKEMQLKYTESGKRFYWYENQDPEKYPFYRVSVRESDKRDATDIPIEEISNAVRDILDNQISMNRNDLVKETARIFGFSRIGGIVESTILDGIEKAVKRGFAKIEDDRVFHIETNN